MLLKTVKSKNIQRTDKGSVDTLSAVVGIVRRSNRLAQPLSHSSSMFAQLSSAHTSTNPSDTTVFL